MLAEVRIAESQILSLLLVVVYMSAANLTTLLERKIILNSCSEVQSMEKIQYISNQILSAPSGGTYV